MVICGKKCLSSPQVNLNYFDNYYENADKKILSRTYVEDTRVEEHILVFMT